MAGRLQQGARSVRQGNRDSGSVLVSLDGGGGGDRVAQGKAWGNLGSFYLSLGQYTKAIELHEQRLTVTKEVGDSAGQGTGGLWRSVTSVSVRQGDRVSRAVLVSLRGGAGPRGAGECVQQPRVCVCKERRRHKRGACPPPVLYGFVSG